MREITELQNCYRKDGSKWKEKSRRGERTPHVRRRSKIVRWWFGKEWRKEWNLCPVITDGWPVVLVRGGGGLSYCSTNIFHTKVFISITWKCTVYVSDILRVFLSPLNKILPPPLWITYLYYVYTTKIETGYCFSCIRYLYCCITKLYFCFLLL